MLDNAIEIEKIIEEESVGLEEMLAPEASPLNEPVVNKEEPPTIDTPLEEPSTEEEEQPPQDADEQIINEDYDEDEMFEEEQEMPFQHAKTAADALIGVTNNLLEMSAGFVVKISKEKSFYEHQEVIEIIDERNVKNIERIKIDKEDKKLLRPLLAQVLQKKAKKLTPEQQLLGVGMSILLKKGKEMVEMRAENKLIVEQIREIIQESTPEETETSVEEVA